MTKSIYDIQKDYFDILEELNKTDGELTEEISKKLEIAEEELQSKAINYAKYIKKLEGDGLLIKQEVARLKEIEARNKKKVDKLKDVVVSAMKLYGIEKIEEATLKLSLRKSESVEIVDESKLSDNFFETKIEKKVSKKALKEALKTGELEGARLVNKQSLQIK